MSLACHDLRTPLATIHGFARTVPRVTALSEPAARYLDLIASASLQMEELIGQLGTAARAEAGRLTVVEATADTLELARAAAASEEAVDAQGSGAAVVVDRERAVDALTALARGALRHGGVERISLRAAGSSIELSPVTASVADALMGGEPRDFEAAVALRVLEVFGASASHDGEALAVRFRPAT